MKIALSLACLLLSALSAVARIGESESEIEARYGKPTASTDELKSYTFGASRTSRPSRTPSSLL
jgi:hypothetical protein